MASLLDIGPLTEEVEVHGVKVTVHGWTAAHVFQLFADFPEIRKLLETKQGDPQSIMLSLAPDLIAKVITMATGAAGNKEAEAKVRDEMGVGEQAQIFDTAYRLSFPNGLGPFVEQITALMNRLATGFTAATPSRTPSTSTTKSPSASSASLQTDTPAGMRGHARHVN